MSESAALGGIRVEADMARGVEASAPGFRLAGPLRSIEADGCLARLPAGPAATLDERVRSFFSGSRPGPALLVGALPFDPHRGDALYQPERVTTPAALGKARAALPAARASGTVAEPAAADYAASVARCLSRLMPDADDPHALRKVVLARSLRVEMAAAVEPHALAARLASDPAVTTYAVPLPVGAGQAPAWLVGATPELLVSRRGDGVVSHPLAGSARRWPDAGRDAAAAEALLASAKDQDEHRYVVEAILDTLAPLCSRLRAPPRPSLQSTRTMWHLGTRIEGRLKQGLLEAGEVSVAALAGLLHPTPAVCGTPRERALEAIRALEPVERGFYAGAVGWADAEGDGDWYVSIRCARVQDRAMRLFAGAGIVAGSQPALEVEETGAKFGALLDALGIGDVPAA